MDKIEQKIQQLESKFAVSIKDLGLSPYEVDKILQEELGYKREEWETNGWQGDNWINYSHISRKPLTLGFCAWDFDIKFMNLED